MIFPRFSSALAAASLALSFAAVAACSSASSTPAAPGGPGDGNGDAGCATCEGGALGDGAGGGGDSGLLPDGAPDPSACGNGKLDPGEGCDGALFGSATCATLGYAGGTIACQVDCTVSDLACYNTCNFQPTDIATATVTTTLTLNGAAWPSGGISGNDDPPVLVFVRQDDASELEVAADKGSAVAPLVKGTYDVFVRANASVVGNVYYTQRVPLAKGLAVTGASTQTFDVGSATVTTPLTLNGATWPTGGISGSDDAPILVFVRQDDGSELQVATASGSAVVPIAKGTYDVFVRANASVVGNVYYTQRIPVAKGLAVTGNFTHPVDVGSATVTTPLTLNGAPWPTGGISGSDDAPVVVLVRQDDASELRVAATAGSAAVPLAKGTYDVFVRVNASVVGNVYYTQKIPVTKGLTVTGSFTHPIDVGTATVTVPLTLNGAAWPTGGIGGSDDAPVVSFVRQDDASELRVAATGGSATAALAKGSYDVFVRANASVVGNVYYTQNVPVAKGVSVTADVTRPVDVGSATVTVKVTLNGAAWPAVGIGGNDDAPVVSFVRQDDASEFRVAATGGSAAAALAKGTYDVFVRANASVVGNVYYSQTIPATKGLTVTGSFTHPIDVATSAAAGALTLNGATWPLGGVSGSDDDPVLVWRRTDDASELAVAAPKGAFSQPLAKGIYDVFFEGNSSVVGNVYYAQRVPLRRHCLQ